MARKVRYGLKNTKYALWDAETKKYGEYKSLPWAVNLALSTEGGDGSDFYADDGICFQFAGTNGGYSGDLEVANIPDEVRVALLGEVVDTKTGVQFEMTDAEPPEFALVTEMTTDEGPIAFCFYNCKASRPELNANTKNDSPDVDTETLSLRVGSREVTYLGNTKHVVQGHIQKTATNAEQYAAFFAAVVMPTETAE
jgi:phi13 family phage major tail protein